MGNQDFFRVIGKLTPDRIKVRPDEVDLIERCSEDYDTFVLNLFRQGHSHVGYGENHNRETLHRSVVELLPQLKSGVALDYICLELEHTLQADIDGYLKR